VFPSEYINILVVSPLTNPALAGRLSPWSEIAVFDINDSDTEEHPGWSHSLPICSSKKQCQLHTKRSWKILKNKLNHSNSELQARFGKQSKKRQSIILNLLKSGDLEYWRRLHWDIILPILSERHIYQGSDWGRYCEDTCQLKLHSQSAKH